MKSLLRALHALSVALWFGTVAFFGVAALLIFDAFREVSALPAEERPMWLPLPADLAKPTPEGAGLPEPLRLEQGSRAAGVAVGRIFPLYYALQTGCGLVALWTAWALARGGEGRWNRWRIGLALAALLTVVVGWWWEVEVARLRVPRNEATDQFLAARDSAAREGLTAQVKAARAQFGMAHGISLLQSYVTLALVAGLTLLVPGVALPRLPGSEENAVAP